MLNIEDAPCISCQNGYGSPHSCDSLDHCPCDGKGGHQTPARGPVQPSAAERQFFADLEVGIVKLAEAAATLTTCVLPAAQVRAVLSVLEAVAGAPVPRPAPQPGDRD